jgi:hypothetical protein
MKGHRHQVRLSKPHASQNDESVVVGGTGEVTQKDISEMPIPPTTVEGDERLNEAPLVLSDTHETHDAEEYDERAAKFWSVYVEEAENHDKALVETWKDDMEGILIFVRIPLSPVFWV